MIIAIGGVSRSGKSTLGENLQIKFGDKCVQLEQDDYIVAEGALPKIRSRTDWESPFSIDWTTFETSIQQANRDYEVVIVTGFLVFYQDSINQLYDHNFLIELDYHQFLLRRAKDTRWQHLEPGAEPRWYQDHVWTSYLQFGLPIAAHKYHTLLQQPPGEMLAETISLLDLEMNLP
jgi:uridine kinase